MSNNEEKSKMAEITYSGTIISETDKKGYWALTIPYRDHY
jgi:hypothetical protein